MFQVFDNNVPADCTNNKVDPSWKTSKFTSFDEALKYARKWLGPYGGSCDGENGIVLQLNVPWDYSGYGDTILIQEATLDDQS